MTWWAYILPARRAAAFRAHAYQQSRAGRGCMSRMPHTGSSIVRSAVLRSQDTALRLGLAQARNVEPIRVGEDTVSVHEDDLRRQAGLEGGQGAAHDAIS